MIPPPIFKRTARFCILACVFVFQLHCHATHYRVYLIGGQSNGTGRGDVAQLTDALAQYALPQTDVQFYYRKTLDSSTNETLAEDVWIDLEPGSGHGQTAPVHEVEFGPEIAFGRSLADAYPTENVAIIKFTYGGSNLHTQWADSGTLYTTFASTVEAGLAALTAAGHTYELRGMIWQQGEADTSEANSAAYEANLTDLIQRVRSDFFVGLNRPFVIGGLSDNQNVGVSDPSTGFGTVRVAQETVAQALDLVGFADSDGFSVYETATIHFDALGQIALGSAHATEMLLLETLDADFDGLTLDQETALGTDPNLSDSDHDGQGDGMELLFGTNPLNGGSRFAVTDIAKNQDIVTLSWPSKAGNFYSVELSLDLIDWTVLESDYPAEGSGTTTSWMIQGVAPPDTFALFDAKTDLNGNFDTTAFDSVDTEDSSTITRLVQGGSLTGGGSSAFVLDIAFFNSSPSGSPGFNFAGANTASQMAAATAGDWFAVTVEAVGASVNYESLSFYSNQVVTGTKVDVSYTIGTIETFVLQDYNPPERNASVAIHTIDFGDFSSSEDVTWTFYIYAATSGAFGTRFDDITLFGSTNDSEPSKAFFRVNLE